MAGPSVFLERLIGCLRDLDEETLSEISDFVEFISQKKDKKGLRCTSWIPVLWSKDTPLHRHSTLPRPEHTGKLRQQVICRAVHDAPPLPLPVVSHSPNSVRSLLAASVCSAVDNAPISRRISEVVAVIRRCS